MVNLRSLALSCRILSKLRLHGKRRVIRRPSPGRTLELDNGWLTVSRWPEYPFSRVFTLQCCGQRELYRRSLAEANDCGRFRVFPFCKGFRTQEDVVLAPRDQIRPALSHAAFLRLAYKLIKTIEGLLQSPVSNDAAQTWHR